MADTMPLYGVGTTAAGVVSLDLLGLPWPKAEVVDYAVYIENGDGDRVGQGWLQCAWRFHGITTEQAAVMLAYLGNCYIRTLLRDGTYQLYSAKMVEPPRIPPKAGTLFDWVVEFRKLVAV